ncbi:protein NPAT isoform X2 [Engystomops pustulosus]|uniref:protein NPAT isoform X2 n=1 Tax=Engystomops pustulosus TaxID=76066 RepID=UPI003AFA0D5A
MLLPSDVARLVLGYLQQEKLTSTCRSFIAESPNLKEYAEHHTEDGTIPGCLLSLLGKNLTTILNEYVTMKAKENQAEVPFMVSSLWKKLDLTLSQIRSMQESAAFHNHQRGSPTPNPVIQQTSTPIMATQYVLRPLHTPGALQPIANSSFGGESTVPNNNSTTLSIIEPAQSSSTICTQKKPPTAATASPMRRKQDVQRRRRAAPLSSSTVASDAGTSEDVDGIQTHIDNDFPQMVIENAREKILSNKSLQEKLAENINKFLGSDSAAQSSKPADGTTAEQDASIDEILGLQGGEIHMSEEAIHDILTQTELDPDFQELYDLFACVTSKTPKLTSRDTSTNNNDLKNSANSNDPKNVTEKGKKLIVERVLDIECSSADQTKKSDIGSKGKESTNIADQTNGKSLDQTPQLPSTSQQASTSEKSISDNQTSSSDNQDRAIVESTDGDTVMDTSTDLHEVEVDTSEVQDVEMNNLSLSKEGAEYEFQIAKDMSSPPSISVGDKLVLSVTGSPKNANEEPKNLAGTEVTNNLTPSKEMLKDPGKNDPIISTPTRVGGTPQKERDNCAITSCKQSPCSAVTNPHVNTVEMVASAVKEQTLQNSAVNIDLPTCAMQVNVTPETPNSSVPSTSQINLDQDSSVVTVNIITDDLSDDHELRNAVSSINLDNYATIILSPLVKSQVIPGQENCVIDLTDSPLVEEQAQLVATASDGSVSLNALGGDCTVYSIAGTSNNTGDGSVIQIMPATSSTYAPTGNIYINSGAALPSNVVMLSNSSNAPNQKQPSLFQTPPRPGSVYTVGQTMSPKLSQGSTIILASPVQPVLQGMVGMFPVSLMGQSGGTFTAPSHQILHVPVSKPIVPKLPLPRTHKSLPLKSSANTGKSLSNSTVADSSSVSSSLIIQRLGNEGKRSEPELLNKSSGSALPGTSNAIAKEVEAHRRVLCFDGTTLASAKLGSTSSTHSKSQKADVNDSIKNLASSSPGSVCSSSSRSNTSKENKKNKSPTSSSIVKNPKTSSTTKDLGKVSTTSAAPTKDLGKVSTTSAAPLKDQCKDSATSTATKDHRRDSTTTTSPTTTQCKDSSAPTKDHGKAFTASAPTKDHGKAFTASAPTKDHGKAFTASAPTKDQGKASTTSAVPLKDQRRSSTTTSAPTVDKGKASTTSAASSKDQRKDSTTTAAPTKDQGKVSKTSSAPTKDHGKASTTSAAPSKDQRRDSTATAAPSKDQRRDSTATAAASKDQRRDSTATAAASKDQRRDSTATAAATKDQRRDSTATAAATKDQRRDSTANAAATKDQRRDSTTTSAPTKDQCRDSTTTSAPTKDQRRDSTANTAPTKDQAADKRPAAPSGNKENVLQVEAGSQRAEQADKRNSNQESEKNVKRPQETSKKPTSLPNILRRTPQKVPPERVCPTSPLLKQASHLLQGMQFQSPPPKQLSPIDLPHPSTPGSVLDDKPLDSHIDQTRTPTCKRYNEDGGTPKPVFPPATPDLPTCSPASEAGSENSVNMAAHTLMILSRASLSKSTGNTPLKDNTQQVKSSKGASKKRKLEDTEEFQRPSHKKEHLSPSSSQKKKKAKKQRRKSMDSFPAGMDVDKFLMSLHYDE